MHLLQINDCFLTKEYFSTEIGGEHELSVPVVDLQFRLIWSSAAS